MQNFLLVVIFLSFAVAFSLSFFKLKLSAQRYIYWSCTSIAIVAGLFSVYPNWNTGIWLAGACAGVMIVAAYWYTPYLKFGGKVHALTVQDGEAERTEGSTSEIADPELDTAPDSYGGIIAARKLWWMLIPGLLICAVNLYFFVVGNGAGWVAALSLAIVVLLAVPAGYGDASWGYVVARGQYLQFGIATVVTAGLFAVVYLIAYWAGKYSPSRREQSMEYRTHPRHRRTNQEP
jgi:hypothetical protein